MADEQAPSAPLDHANSASPADAPGAARKGFLAKLGLDRPELRAWAMYDWANSAMVTTIMTVVFPIYYVNVAGSHFPEAAANGKLAFCNFIAKLIPAILSPILGAVADARANRKRMLATSMGLGVAAVAGMWFIKSGDILLASVLFVVSSITVSVSFVFYESLLPHIAREEELDRVSTAGYAMGYVGGGLLLAINLLWISKPSWFFFRDAEVATRAAFVSVALWWLVFSLPLLRRVREPAAGVREAAGGNPLTAPFVALGGTLKELVTRHRQTLLMIAAFFVYNDGIMTIQAMAAAYGAELNFRKEILMLSLLLVQFIGIPFAFAFGTLADRIGAKAAVLLGLALYVGIALYGFFLKTEIQFVTLAVMVAVVQGGTQALSRSLFARMVPRGRSGEFFGFFSVFNRFGGMMGTGMFFVMVSLTGESRWAILSVIVFFVVGGALLWFVNVAEGERAARAAEAQALGA